MHVLHVTTHLGGGVGKAHAALAAAMPLGISQTFLLLEPPRDRRYVEAIVAHGAEVIESDDLAEIATLCQAADIVQFEFWNHPRLLQCLARTAFPPMRAAFWTHVSGLFRPLIPQGLIEAADRFVFTSPASLPLVSSMEKGTIDKVSSIGSGFGFATGSRDRPEFAAGEGTPHIAYLGTVDFIKMHPGLFDAMDALTSDASIAIWGQPDADGEVAAKARAMRHPDRVQFMGQTSDPEAALAQSRIFFYPLQPDHYGTAENALIEAMSLGLVPVVLDNPAERAIVIHGITGFIGKTIDECSEILAMLLSSPDIVSRIGANAASHASNQYAPEISAVKFGALWTSMMVEEKRRHDFAPAIGTTPRQWYQAMQGTGAERSALQSKGTLAHFRAVFPDDPSLG